MSTFLPSGAFKSRCIRDLMQCLLKDPCSGCKLEHPCKDKSPQFRRTIEGIKNRFPSAEGWNKRQIVKATGPKELVGYRAALKTVVSDLRLNEEWALEALHQCVASGYYAGGVSSWASDAEFYITWQEGYLTKKEIEKQILQDFNEQWKRLEAAREQEGFERSRKRGKLPTTMRQIYKHVCRRATWETIVECEDLLQRNPGDSERDDDNTVYADPTVIRQNAKPIIELLGLTNKRPHRNPATT